ncbi:3-oxoacyl-ACP reductase, partial [Francisella tularensis subsp. holarctica]|nr:3-oxoacyl-ACP reductase [Francisella tularensis subsp. holarctica]
MSLNEKVDLVTGASRGIGFEVAHALASQCAPGVGAARGPGAAV